MLDASVKGLCILMQYFVYTGKVAVATWGTMNWKDETLKMIIAVSSATIGNLFGLKLSEGYYLKVGIIILCLCLA